VLAGLVAGVATAATAFAPGAAPVAVDTAEVAAPEHVHDVPVGRLRVQEAAIAEWEYRRAAPVAAARSASAPRSAVALATTTTTTTVVVVDAAPRAARRPGGFVRPAAGAVTGVYGERRGHGRHPGLDIDGETGDAVVAAGGGTVLLAGWAPSGYSGYGRMVMIDHGNGITTLYAHLSKIAVGDGEVVEAGQYIGAIGTTGVSTGSHLHFEVRVGGQTVNPANWI
jgi:murein DD-endopeptidase MepM/ murein hydrolase activator NlpD